MNRLNNYLILISMLPLISSCGLFSLLNSGTAHLKYTMVKADLEGRTYENKSRLGEVSFSVRNVQHPKAYGKWNTNIKLSPSIHADNITYQTGARKDDGSAYPNINVKRLISFANLKWSTHTPMGAFVLTGGFGGTVYKMSNGDDINTIKTREIRRIDLAYIAFFSKRFFLLMGPRYYREGYDQYVFAFRLGYFWGPIQKSNI